MTTADPEIIPRDLRFGVGDHPDPRWLGGDQAGSALVDAFAVMLPEGERYFIRALKPYLKDVTDPELRQDILDFCAQEAFHTREHLGYNAALRSLGYQVDRQEESVRWFFARFDTPLARLYLTCAIEHITYALSRIVIERPEIMDKAHPAYRRLWRWHALEEVEHSSVGLRVLRAVTPGVPGWKRYILRCAALGLMLPGMVGLAMISARRNLRATGGPSGWALWRAALFSPGWLRRMVPTMFAYLRPGYLGRNDCDAALVAKARHALDAEMAAA